MSTISNTIESTVRSAGYGHYLATPAVQSAITDIEANLNGDDNVRSVVTEALAGNGLASYITYAGPVVEALESVLRLDSEDVADFRATPEADEGFDREHAAEVIRRAASNAGVQATEVEEVLVEAGLVDPEPEPEPEVDEDDSDESVGDIARRIEQTISNLAAQVEALTGFARQNGFRG